MKWIILDAMGVVFTEDTINLIIDFVQKKKEFSKEKIEELYLRGSLGEYKSKYIWESLDLGDFYPEIEKEYLENNFVLQDDFIETMIILKKDYKIGMISNDVLEWSEYLRELFDIEKLFDRVVISGDVKCRKPDKKIYEYFLEEEELNASDCIFVDDIEENLEMAKRLGINVIKFGSKDSSGIYETVDSFKELIKKIGNF